MIVYKILLKEIWVKKLKKSLLDDAKSYKFNLGTGEYIAYQDDEGRYHVNEVNQVGIYAGNARYSKFQDRLYGLLDRHTFDIRKIEEPAVDQLIYTVALG